MADIVEEDDGQMGLFDLGDIVGQKVCALKTTGVERSGCMFCALGCGAETVPPNRFQRMAETHPKLYDYCINGGEYVDGLWQPSKDGLGFGKVLDFVGVKY